MLVYQQMELYLQYCLHCSSVQAGASGQVGGSAGLRPLPGQVGGSAGLRPLPGQAMTGGRPLEISIPDANSPNKFLPSNPKQGNNSN